MASATVSMLHWGCMTVLLVAFSSVRDCNAQACGGDFTNLEGTITSPLYPNTYSNNMECVYVIKAPTGYRITLTFLDFFLEPETFCSYDFLEVYDGGSLTSPLLGSRFCGNTLPTVQRTSQNVMLILFSTHVSGTFRGFNASYTSAIIPIEFVLLANNGFIFRADIVTLSYTRVVVPSTVGNGSILVAVYYDPVDDRVYWTDVLLREIRSIFSNGSDNTLVRSLNTVATPDGMAVDSQSRLVFYTDVGNKIIALIMISTFEHRFLITTKLDRPRAIVLDTINGIMFWSDWGTSPKIERANYDGSDRIALVSTDLIIPTGLALDTANDRLYWADGWTRKLEFVNTMGNFRTTIYSSLNTHYFGLALYNDKLYITDWTSEGALTNMSYIERINTDGTNFTTIVSSTGRFNGIHIYSANTSKPELNACGLNNGRCSHICIPLPGNVTKCLCPDGQYLLPDQETCSYACGETFTALEGVITSPFYPNNYTNNLDCIYVIRAPSGYRVTLSFHDLRLQASYLCNYDNLKIYDGEFLNSSLIGGYLCNVPLPYDVRTIGDRMLIQFKTDNSVTDRGFNASYITKIIPQEFMLVTTSRGEIDRVEIHTISIVKVPVVGLYQPFGIHYDPVDDRMYWTDISLKEIRSAFLNGSDNRLVRHVGPGKTSGTLDGITLDTQSRLIFYTDAGNQVIGLITISTYQHKYVINDNLDKPRAIVLDCLNGIIFWTDWGQNARIERANYDGSDRKVIVRTNIVQPNGLALDASRNHLYWADSGTHLVERTDTAGLDRTEIREDTNAMFFSLALNNDRLYLAVWPSSWSDTSYVDGMNSDGTDISLGYITNNRINGIYVYSAISTGTGPNGCSHGQGGCSHICIPSSGNNAKCMCPSGQYLSDDQKTCLSEACGETFTALEGVITSPFYPNNYPNDLDCKYVIRAPTGYRVTLSFHDLSLEASDSCKYDNLKIYDGEFLNSSVIGNLFCKVTLPYDVRTTGDRMLIQFKTDISVTDRGFNASYITSTETSLNYPLIGGAAGGGLVLILLIIVIIVCVKRRRDMSSNDRPRPRPHDSRETEGPYVTSSKEFQNGENGRDNIYDEINHTHEETAESINMANMDAMVNGGYLHPTYTLQPSSINYDAMVNGGYLHPTYTLQPSSINYDDSVSDYIHLI